MEKIEVTVEPKNGLTKLKKAELINIILRKDELEKNLRVEVKEAKTELQNIYNASNKLGSDYNSLKEKVVSLSEEYAKYKDVTEDVIQDYKEKYLKMKQKYDNLVNINTISAVLNILLGALVIMMCF